MLPSPKLDPRRAVSVEGYLFSLDAFCSLIQNVRFQRDHWRGTCPSPVAGVQLGHVVALGAKSGTIGNKPQRNYHLLVIEQGPSHQTVSLEAATYSVGRHPANSIVLDVITISRQHALLLRIHDPITGNHFFRIIDGNLQGTRSRNGITVNGQRQFSYDLKDQDLIVFGGEVQATYHLVDADNARLSPTSAFFHAGSQR